MVLTTSVFIYEDKNLIKKNKKSSFFKFYQKVFGIKRKKMVGFLVYWYYSITAIFMKICPKKSGRLGDYLKEEENI